MQRERTIATRPRCLHPDCRSDAEPGQLGYCNPHGQAVRRRIDKGEYKKDELVARGKIVVKSIDVWLRN